MKPPCSTLTLHPFLANLRQTLTVLLFCISLTDVLHEDQVDRLIEVAVKDYGRIDYVCNAAGVLSNNERSTETSSKDFDQINGVNYRGCWLASRAELAQMLKQDPLPTHDGRPGNRGSIVNIASQLGIVGRSAAREPPPAR